MRSTNPWISNSLVRPLRSTGLRRVGRVVMSAACALALAATSYASPSPSKTASITALAPPASKPPPGHESPASPNPFLHYLPAGTPSDYRTWRPLVHRRSHERARSLPRALERGFNVVESETNDLLFEADPIAGLVAEGATATLSGTTDVQPFWATVFVAPAETAGSNNDGLFEATFVSLGSGARQRIQGTIGDGPFGSADQDYYTFSLVAGDSLTVDIDTASGPPDTAVVILAEYPYQVLDFTFSNPFETGSAALDAYASATAPYTGTYWVAVSSTSGTGDYELRLGRNTGVDLFSVELEAGDVLGLASSIEVDLAILGPDGRERFGSAMATSDLLPPTSPLPTTTTGAEVADVASVSGTHYIRVRAVRDPPQAYTVEARVLRPGPERSGTEQVIFLDFDGATLDSDALFETGPAYTNVTLSPLSAFLGNWGLLPADESAVIDAVVATVQENLDDLAATNPALDFELRNSRDHADPFGQPGVSRVVIGGTKAQLGRDTIGVSSVVDPGNFSLEDTAVVLLDVLSETNTGASGYLSSLNRFSLAGGVDEIELVGRGVGSVAAHEIGHFLGLWHTDVQNSVLSLIDSGGDLAGLLGSTDLIIGDGDDIDVDFVEDVLTPGSGLRGVEDQAARAAFALTGSSLVFADGFEGGNTAAWQ